MTSRKINISIVFITQWYFDIPKEVRLNTTHLFITKIPNKRQLQQVAYNHSSDIHFNDFMNNVKKNVLKKNILFELMIRLYHQVTFYGLEKIFWNEYVLKSWQLMIKLRM